MVGKTSPKSTKTATKSTKLTKTTKIATKGSNINKKTTSKAQKKKGFPWRKAITLVVCMAIPLAAGMISAALTGSAMEQFGQFNQPPLSPPAWLFPVAWTILYILMGVALYFIYGFRPSDEKEKKIRIIALALFFIQLALNFIWSPIFFLANDFLWALIVLIVMWLATIVMMILVRKHVMAAVWCLVPYALWLLFAGYLNIGIMLMN